MNKTYILDTNVLLDDSEALFGFGKNNVVIPFVVLMELDKHKVRQDEVGRNARETARKIAEITKKDKDLVIGVPIGENLGKLRILSLNQAAKRREDILEVPSELDEYKSGDNDILKFCLNYIVANNRETVILITRDTLLRIKAEALSITCEDYNKFNVIKEAEELYSGFCEIETEEVQNFYTDQEYILPKEIEKQYNLKPNQFLILKDSRNTSAIAKFVESGKPLEPVGKHNIGKISPKNKEQEFLVDLLMDPDIKLVTVNGLSGSGKTLLSIAAGLEQTIGSKKKYKNMIICRPTVPVGNDIGFLPGAKEEKLDPWIAPIKDNLRLIFSDGKKTKNNEETLKLLFDNGTIEVEAITYLRGRSISNAFILIDEVQNASAHELKTILTRVGENSKIVLTGDIEQIDTTHLDSVSNALSIAIEKFKDYKIAGHITLKRGERSELATLASKILD